MLNKHCTCSDHKPLLYNNSETIPRRTKETSAHHRSILLGIFIGIVFSIGLLTFLQPISMNYNQTQLLYNVSKVNDDMVTLISSRRNNTNHEDKSSSIKPIDMISHLYDNVRILCMVHTYKDNYRKKAWWVNQTWGRRCNKLLFMANKPDETHTIEVTVLNINETRDNLWGKTKASFKHAYDHYLDDYDWFLKADDDTYVIMENLRYFLYPYPIDLPLYFGFEFTKKFMSGGAGYIVSREAVKVFIEKALPDTKHCKPGNTGVEDVEMGNCLNSVNVTIGDSIIFLYTKSQLYANDEVNQQKSFSI